MNQSFSINKTDATYGRESGLLLKYMWMNLQVYVHLVQWKP